MKIDVKSIKLNITDSTAIMVLSVNGEEDQKCTVKVINLDAVIEKKVNKIMSQALAEINATC